VRESSLQTINAVCSRSGRALRDSVHCITQCSSTARSLELPSSLVTIALSWQDGVPLLTVASRGGQSPIGLAAK
jgi:hypothetical protein